MSDRDVPHKPRGPGGPLSLGPLDRMRAQLAGPRGYRRIDALLSADDAAGAIGELAPSEIFELVHEVGFEDAADLIHLATPAQIQGCLDLDGWTKDQLELAPLAPWLSALLDAGFEKFGEVWSQLDAELRALILQRQVRDFQQFLTCNFAVRHSIGSLNFTIRKTTFRVQYCAISSSCVTRMMVMPLSFNF